MAVEKILYEDTLRQGADKINAILEQSNVSSQKVDSYDTKLTDGIEDAKKLATDAGQEAIQIATQAGDQANIVANEAKQVAQNANTKSDQATATANQNKQEFNQLRNDFDDLVAEAGDSNPEIVQARTDTQGIKQTNLSNRLTTDFNNRMSKADGIEMISGQTIVSRMMDFQGKTAGNTATNPNVYYSDFTANTLKKPNASWNEVSQADYNKLASRDDSGISTGSNAAGIIPQQLSVLDTVKVAKSLSPQLFDELTNQESVKLIKDNFVSFTVGIRVKALSPNNKNVKVGLYMPASDSWSTAIQQDATEFTDFTTQINDNQYIDGNGKVYLVCYVDASNGVKPSSVEVDYAGVQLELTMNAQEVLQKSGFSKTEDIESAVQPLAKTSDLAMHTNNKNNPHGVTKVQVKLGDVQNYSIATEDEAKTGVSDEKYMTPAKVKMAIDEQRPIEDTGWVNIPLNNGWTGLGGYTPQVRVLNKIMYFRGSLEFPKVGRFGTVPIKPVTWRRSGFRQGLHSTVTGAGATVYVNEGGSIELVAITQNSHLWLSGIQLPVD